MWQQDNVARAASLKYHGYYGFYGAGVDAPDMAKFNNFVLAAYYDTWDSNHLASYLNGLDNDGYKIILLLTGYFNNNAYGSDSEWQDFLNKLKTKLGDNVNKVWGFYVWDEPEDHFSNIPDRVTRAIEMTKATFPTVNTLVVFFEPWTSNQYNFITNPNLDYIGINPYFLTKSIEEAVSNSGGDPYACDVQMKGWFDYKVLPSIYWIKSGGNYIQNACNNNDWPRSCTPEQLAAINAVISRDTNKKIIIAPQSFTCNSGPFKITDMPSICQQQWYYDYAKSDPDVYGLLWYKYSLVDDYIQNAPNDCLGVGKSTPTFFTQHNIWGLEVLCSNQEYNPYCAENGVSYKSPDQAKCAGKKTTGHGGAGNNLCDVNCGADQGCNGIAPGAGSCNDNCKASLPSVPVPVITSISSNPATLNETVSFSGSGTDPNRTIIGYNWRSSIDGQLSTSKNFTTNNLSVGEHKIYFKVQYIDGTWSPEAVQVLTINQGEPINDNKTIGIKNPLESKIIKDIINNVYNILKVIAIGGGVIMIIIGGIMIMTSQGSEEKVTKGKKIIKWTLISVAIVLSAQFIIGLIKELIS